MQVQFFEAEELYREAIKKYKSAASHFDKGNVAHAVHTLMIGAKAFGAAECILQYSHLSGAERDKAISLSTEAEMSAAAAFHAMHARGIR